MEVESEARGKGSHCFPMKKSLLSNELFGVQLGEILRILHDISHCDAEKKVKVLTPSLVQRSEEEKAGHP